MFSLRSCIFRGENTLDLLFKFSEIAINLCGGFLQTISIFFLISQKNPISPVHFITGDFYNICHWIIMLTKINQGVFAMIIWCVVVWSDEKWSDARSRDRIVENTILCSDIARYNVTIWYIETSATLHCAIGSIAMSRVMRIMQPRCISWRMVTMELQKLVAAVIIESDNVWQHSFMTICDNVWQLSFMTICHNVWQHSFMSWQLTTWMWQLWHSFAGSDV